MSTVVLEDVMEIEPPQEKSSAAILSGLPEGRNGDLPEWFRTRQTEAWKRFLAAPAPNRKDQPWRFSNVNALDLAPFFLADAPSDESTGNILSRSRVLENVAARMIFADDHLLRHDSLPDALCEKGVIFQPLERGLVEHADLFQKHFMAQPTPLGSAKFAALHEALVRGGSFLYVPKGVEIEAPIEIFHWLSAENAAVFPHTLLIADELSKVTVIEHFRSATKGRTGFSCGVNDLVVGRGAKLKYVCVQDWDESVLSIQMNATTAERDAAALSLNANVGGAYSRFESFSRLTGEGARSDLLAVAIAQGSQEFDARTLQDHASPHTTSDLLYKNSLTDHARTTFGGLIRVEPEAHFTDAYQTVRNLLLSDDAEANSMPGLEILADNVKCSHGATTGQLAEDELFYLLARGIPRHIAQHMLVAGFLNEVVDRLDHPVIAAKLHDLIEAKFARG
ncbi:MAG: Fe-S cluster assembly protein SufD [Chthoniobacterales bacterium]